MGKTDKHPTVGLLTAAILLCIGLTLQIAGGRAQAQVSSNGTQYATRADTVISLLLARSPNIPKVPNIGQFPDVQRGARHEPFMLAAEKFGIISAEEGTDLLRPGASVTRAEYVKMLTLTFGLPLNLQHDYTDVPAESWYAPYAGAAEKYNLFALRDQRMFEPARAITRSEMIEGLRIFLLLRDKKENVRLEQQMSGEQAAGKLTLYSVISTRKLKVVFIDDKHPQQRRLTQTALVNIPPSLPQLRTTIVQLVNDIRIQHGLRPLTYNSLLEQSAQGYADTMATKGFFAHVSPTGETLRERVERTGYYDRSFSSDCLCVKGYSLGENLARGQKTPEEAVEAWMDSPSHRAAILNRDYTDIGIGASAGFWVQHFGGVLLPNG